MQYSDQVDIMSYTLQVIQKLYNVYPSFRKNLEGPIVAILLNILKIYQGEKMAVWKKLSITTEDEFTTYLESQGGRNLEQKLGVNLVNANKKYIEAQKFCNFLMVSGQTSMSLK